MRIKSIILLLWLKPSLSDSVERQPLNLRKITRPGGILLKIRFAHLQMFGKFGLWHPRSRDTATSTTYNASRDTNYDKLKQLFHRSMA